MIEDISAIKNEGRLEHLVVYSFPIERGEFVPFGADGNCVGVSTRLVGVAVDFHTLLHHFLTRNGWMAKNISMDKSIFNKNISLSFSPLDF